MNKVSKQLIVVSRAAINSQQVTQNVTLFNAAGQPLTAVKTAAAQADTTAADLAALKVDFNLLLAKLRTAGVIAA